MELVDEKEEQAKQLKPHWKAGAIVLALVVIIVGLILFRGGGRPSLNGEGPNSAMANSGADPSQFGDTAATATATPSDLSENNCEDPANRCANNCKVAAADVGSCDWQGVGGSTATLDAAVKTIALDLQKVQEQQSHPDQDGDEESDLAYSFDQFLKYYKNSLTPADKKILSGMSSPDALEQKAIDLLKQ